MSTILNELRDLETAEDFFEFFEVSYDPNVIATCRLHILQRAHDYLSAASLETATDDEVRARMRAVLEKAYRDFTTSDPLTERVFKVLKEAKDRPPTGSQGTFISLDEIGGVPKD